MSKALKKKSKTRKFEYMLDVEVGFVFLSEILNRTMKQRTKKIKKYTMKVKRMVKRMKRKFAKKT